MKFIMLTLDLLIPRFITEYVACGIDDDGNYVTICAVDYLLEGEIPDGVIRVTSFNLFGFAIFSKKDGEIMTFYEYLKIK